MTDKLPRIFGRVFSWSHNIHTKSLEPLIHIEDLGDEIIITMDLPYVRKEDIDIYLTERILEVKAQMCRKYRCEGLGRIQKGIEFESFHKIIELPSNIIPEKARSRFKDGILEIRLPKRIRKRKIDIK